MGISIGSGTKLKDNITPLTKLVKMERNVKNPNSEFISWNATDNMAKYLIRLSFRILT
jgi:hypothetical protein